MALSALADPTRRAIYESLRGATRAVGDIAGGFPVSRPAVSQHLRALREAGLVTESRQGTRRLYAANPQAALELRDYFQSMWQCALQSYASHVIEEERHAVENHRSDQHPVTIDASSHRDSRGAGQGTQRISASSRRGKRGR